MIAWVLLAATVSAGNLRVTVPTARGSAPAVMPVMSLTVSPLSATALTPSLAPTLAAAAVAPTPALTAAAAAPVIAAAEAPEALPAIGAAPADAPSFVHRTLGALGKALNPFGGSKKPGDETPVSEAARLDAEFMTRDLWGEVAPKAKAELVELRARKMKKAEFKEYVQNEAAAAFERVKAARGVANIGLHYNLHGGQRKDYVGSGIRASQGDIALRYGGGDNNHKVYFFQTRDHHPYVALDASNGEILFFPSRMGHVLNFFDVDAPEILAAKAAGKITNHSSIYMDFHGMRGVPYSTYLAPPIEVFNGSAKKALGIGRLSRDEETLATVRYIEAVLLAGGAYVPR